MSGSPARRLSARLIRRARIARRKILATPRSWYKRLRRWHSMGARGERIAARYLERNLYHIWEQNLRNVAGEIDLIASKRRTLVFVEVKTRSTGSQERFSGVAAVDDEKTRRLQAVAARYIRDNRALLKQRRIRSTRFDILEVLKGAGPASFHVRQHIEGI